MGQKKETTVTWRQQHILNRQDVHHGHIALKDLQRPLSLFLGRDAEVGPRVVSCDLNKDPKRMKCR
jgi:hypothetical protein